MANLTVYTRGSPEIHLNDPNPAQIVEYLNLLDGFQLLSMQLVTSEGYLTIFASQEGRMHLYFTNGAQDGYLIDPDKSEEPLFEFRLDNGGIDDWSLRETITRSAAIEVAVYFLENNSFPKELHWVGNMQAFTK